MPLPPRKPESPALRYYKRCVKAYYECNLRDPDNPLNRETLTAYNRMVQAMKGLEVMEKLKAKHWTKQFCKRLGGTLR